MAEPNPFPPVLEMENVTVATLKNPEIIVLEDVNWTVRTGDFWAVVGLHRSGKTDLTAVAAGLMPPARGTCRMFDHPFPAALEDEQLQVRRRIGLVFDGGQLLNQLSIAENVALPLRYHDNLSAHEAEPRIQPLLELTGLLSSAHHAPAALSRNWQQRVGLARALALKPDLLVLDTPLTGLDPRDAAWWLDLLTQLSKGHSIVDGRPMTLVATGDDLRPWKGRARQTAILKAKKFITLDPAGDSSLQDSALME